MEERATLTPGERLAIERWFVRRGVPQLVEGYESEARLDTRAAPLIVLWLAVGTALFWGVNPQLPWWANVAGVIGTLAAIPVVFIGSRRLRHRPPIGRDITFDLV